MKKRIAFACGLLITVFLSQTAYAGNQTTVGYQVNPEYTVTIPADTAIVFQQSEASMGKILIDQAQIEEGKCIRVSVSSEGKLRSQEHSEDVIPYQILAGNQVFQFADYTTAGQEQELIAKIQDVDWQKAPAGTYTDPVTFQISYVEEGSALATYALAAGNTQTATISATVPDSHQILIDAEHATVTCDEYDENDGDDFAVDRFSTPTLQIAVENGWKMEKVLVNGTDMTAQLHDGTLALPEVYEDVQITVQTSQITSTDGDNQNPQQPPTDNSGDKKPSATGTSDNLKGNPSGDKNVTKNQSATEKIKNALAAVTSDINSPVLYGLIIILAAGAIVTTTFYNRKRKPKK